MNIFKMNTGLISKLKALAFCVGLFWVLNAAEARASLEASGTVRSGGVGVPGVKINVHWYVYIFGYVDIGSADLTTDGAGNYYINAFSTFSPDYMDVSLEAAGSPSNYIYADTWRPNLYNGQPADFLAVQVFSGSAQGVSANAASSVGTTKATLTGTALPNFAFSPRWNFAYSLNADNSSATTIPNPAQSPGHAAVFTGGNYAKMDNVNYFGGGDFTVEGWVYVKSYASWSRFFDFGNAAGSDNILLAVSEGGGGYPTFHIYNNGTVVGRAASIFQLPLNSWVHLAAVKSGVNMYLYMNGTLAGSTTVSAHQRDIVRTSNLLGKSNWADPKMDGYMDDVRIWNVARSQAQLLAGRSSDFSGATAGLVAYWKFDEANTSSTITDSSTTSGSQNGVFYNGSDVANAAGRTDDSISTPGLPAVFYLTSAALTGLIPDTTYYFQGKTTSTPGNNDTSIRNFTTTIGTPTMNVLNTAMNEDAGTYSIFLSQIADGDADLNATYRVELIVNDPTKFRLVNPPASTRARYQLVGNGTTTYTWAEAKRDAERRGGHLATITSSAENDLVKTAAAGQVVWLGMTDEVTEGQFKWVTGETFSYANWNAGEPNDSSGEDYGGMWANGTWNDFQGVARLTYYVIEYEDPAGSVYGVMNLAAGTPLAQIDLGTFFNVNGSSAATLRLIADYGNGKVSSVSQNLTLTLNAVDDPPTIGLGSAIGFNAASAQHLVLPAGTYFNGGAFTVESWVYVTNYGSYSRLFDFGNSAGVDNVLGALSSGTTGKPVLAIYNGTIQTLTSADALPLNQWVHLAFVYDGTTGYIYINGNEKARGAMSAPSNVSRAYNYIGRSNWGGDAYAGMRISEFRIWNVARTPTDLALYSTFPLLGNESGLQVYLRGIEGSGPTVRDFASNASTQGGAQDATMVNTPTWIQAGTANALPMAVSTNGIPVGEDTPRTFYLPGYDFEAAPLGVSAWSISTQPAHGTMTAVAGTAGGYTYMPATNYNGLDQFTYQITANSVTTNYTVYVNVTPDNDPPIVSTIANQNFLESTTNTVQFTAEDPETAAAALVFTVTSSDQGVVPNSGLSVSSSGTNRVLTIQPRPGESGTTVITLRVTDTGSGSFPPATVERTFEVSFEPRPAFAILDLGTLPTFGESQGVAVNDKWEALGMATGNQQLTRGFMYSGPASSAALREILPLSGSVSTAPGALNNKSVLTFASIASNGNGTGVTDDGVSRISLSPPPSTASTYASAFTDDGFWAGSSQISGNWRAIRADTPSSTAVNLGVLSGHTASWSMGINFSNHVVGVSSNANGNYRGFLHNTATMVALPTLTGGTNNAARGVNNQGQVVGESQTTLVDSQVADFSGGRYVTLPNGTWFNGGAFTVEAWVYMRSSANHQRIIDIGNGTGVDNIVIAAAGAPGVYFDIYSNTVTSRAKTASALPVNVWTHIACVFDGTTGTIYINGTASGSAVLNAPRNVNRTKNYIGKSNWAADPASNMLLHDLRIWNVARTATQVGTDKETFDLGTPLPANLQAEYKLNEGSGVTALSTTGDALNGTYTGGAVFSGPTGLAYGPIVTRATLYSGQTASSLGTLPSGGNSYAFGINEFGKIVGSAIYNASSNATLFAAGTLQDVNGLISEADNNLWHLTEARGINRQGAIVGTGTKGGNKRAFLGLPATIVGRKVVRPQGAVTNFPPDIEIIDSLGYGSQPSQFFFWSQGEAKLFATRPCIARLKWYTSSVLTTNTDRIEIITANIWPRNPTIHVVGAPVVLEPTPANSVFGYAYQQLHYPDESTLNVVVDASTKTYDAKVPGWSVVRYVRSGGATPDPVHQPAYFEVVRSYSMSDTTVFHDNVAWTVGDTIGNTNHFDYGRNGWVFFEKSFYDGDGPDRAYDRPTRQGPIIPVNTDTSYSDDLVVGWYHTNQIGVAWPSEAWRYSLSWPTTTTNKIVIASQLGTGSLDETIYKQPRVYIQPDNTRPGFNPNEEHALMAPADTGIGMFALRNDLNGDHFSEPYALLKYKDAQDQWHIKVYRVLTEETPYFFNYSGVAGNEIQAPYPLRLLPLVSETQPVSGPGWKDYHGKIYAKAAGQFGEHTNIVIRYFYPAQPDFFLPSKNTSGATYAVGESMPWLDLMPGGTAGTPHNINFDIAWPDTAPVLNIGDTVLKPKNGLPDILDMANAKIIYDDQVQNSGNDYSNVARMYDPLSPRTYKLASSEKIPDSIVRQSINGKDTFSDLPWVLRKRLSYDPINRWITFEGYFQPDFDVGDPLILPNVMTPAELVRIKKLADGNAAWATIVTKLYSLTRNPDQLDSNWDGAVDDLLLIGLQKTTATINVSDLRQFAISHGTDPYIKPAQVLNAVQRFSGPQSVLSSWEITYQTIVPKQLSSGVKGLTAGFNAPSAQPRPGKALFFDGSNDAATLAAGIDLNGKSFTVEFWAKRASINTDDMIITQGTGSPDKGLHIGFRANNTFAFAFWNDDLNTTATLTDLGWHHFAATFDASTRERLLYRDGHILATNLASAAYTGSGVVNIGVLWNGNSPFHGALDEVRIWQKVRNSFEIQRDYHKKLIGNENGLVAYLRFDEGTGSTVANAAAANASGLPARATLATAPAAPSWIDSDAPAAIPPRYLTVAENDDASLGALPVGLHVIRVDDGPFAGDLKVLLPDNVFDERLTLRHSPDFGGDPSPLKFEWYYQPATDGQPPTLPTVDVDGNISNQNGWIKFTTDPSNGAGINQITIGEGGESSIVTLSDNWFISRYKGYIINSDTNWSDWVGDPASKNPRRPVLAEGWVKRVIRGLNPFDQRINDFRNNDVSTLVSMISQAGQRYEGDIAFNPDASAINSVGLIEAYETVVHRAKNLSIDGTPAVNFAPANNAVLLASTKIADLYTLFGNEAYADAQDPTIGFGTTSTSGNTATYGSLASSIFAFQNQLDSLLEEELVLMRGRDDHAAGTQGAPVYNRLFWNFTLGEGEVAYQQNYNVTDQNKDGFIDERDARMMFPQGHGDAWGHYLSALKEHYNLLRHPYFTWVPTTEAVTVAGAAIEVDFQDERKFARTAGLKAKAGAEIVDLTYRSSYVEDPDGQWQGYKDTDTDRAWGVTEWARRAAMGSYFDWLTASTILPATDPNPAHTGIQKVDRTTVPELKEIIWAHQDVQAKLDAADQGLNPLGLARGVVPFDIDPAQVAAGKTHFEQVAERAVKAMNNAIATWNDANQANELLRKNQDTLERFKSNVQDQERDYKNRLIEIYGYPYAGEIGPGKIYPSGYDGPDIYHYMYVATTELNNDTAPASGTFTNYMKKVHFGIKNTGDTKSGALGDSVQNFYFPEDVQGDISNRLTNDIMVVEMPYTTADWGFRAPSAWGSRRAAGEIQIALSEMIQNEARVKEANIVYDNLMKDIQGKIDLLDARYALRATELKNRNDVTNVKISMGVTILALKATSKYLNSAVNDLQRAGQVIYEAMPKVVGLSSDAFSMARAGVVNGINMGTTAMSIGAAVAEAGVEGAQIGIAITEGVATANIQQAQFTYEIDQQVRQLEALMREEAVKRVECFRMVEAFNQSFERYKQALAKGQRLIEERVAYRQRTAGDVSNRRYQDMTFRIFRNDALQKYRAQFDLAQRYVFLAASAYDYEVNLLGTDSRAGQSFLTDIIRQRALGQMRDGVPLAGPSGLADPLARLTENFGVLKTQLGFNNPQLETGRFSLRNELFRLKASSAADWRAELEKARVPNLWNVQEFRRYCRPFAPESAGAQPGLVIKFATAVRFGENFFGWPLAGGDSAYDPSRFATKISSVGVWFQDYNGNGMSLTPRIYLVPAGVDVLRSPTGNDLTTRQWRVLDQALPVPFTLGSSQLASADYIPSIGSLGGSFAEIRRFASFRGFHDSGTFTETEMISDSRLIGRSVWNSEWLLIIPGGTLLANPNSGLDAFINSVSDVKLFFKTYSYSGN